MSKVQSPEAAAFPCPNLGRSTCIAASALKSDFHLPLHEAEQQSSAGRHTDDELRFAAAPCADVLL
jgi:hypothetical protein